MKGNAGDDVRRMIHREKEIMEGLKRMRASARNKTVRSQCDAQISEASRNIAYLEEKLNSLTVNASEEGDNENSQKTREQRARLTRLDLLRWDEPQAMSARIQLMLQQLEYKMSIEKQYERGTCKLINLYKQTGDRRSQTEAYANLAESTAKLALLKRTKKRYSDMNLAAVLGDSSENMDPGMAMANLRRPLTGVLKIFISQVEEVDHTIAWSDQVEMWVSMKVENNSAAIAHTRPSTTSKMNEEFSIPVDKGNEIEFTVYDRAVGSNSATPVALLWLRISDIVEAVRQKRVERELKDTGWASAAKVQAMNAAVDNDAEVSVASSNQSSGPNGSNGSNGPNGPNGSSDKPVNAPRSDPNHSGNPELPETVEGWFTLEPAGRIYLRLGFEKAGTGQRKRPRVYDESKDLATLGRHNAIRKREETQQVHGHEFVLQQSYNIVKCAVCGDFTTSYFQCQECLLTCDRKCFSKIVTKCRALMSIDPDEEINHRIPHHFEPSTNMKAAWCAQCGFILPLASKKNVRRCTECSVTVHASCAAFVPDLCGMSMTTAAQIINEINSTRIRQATKAAGRSMQGPQRPQRPNSMAPVRTKTNRSIKSIQPPPKNAPIRRKQVPDTPAMKPEQVPVPAVPSVTSSSSAQEPVIAPPRSSSRSPKRSEHGFLQPLEKLEPLAFDPMEAMVLKKERTSEPLESLEPLEPLEPSKSAADTYETSRASSEGPVSGPVSGPEVPSHREQYTPPSGPLDTTGSESSQQVPNVPVSSALTGPAILKGPFASPVPVVPKASKAPSGPVETVEKADTVDTSAIPSAPSGYQPPTGPLDTSNLGTGVGTSSSLSLVNTPTEVKQSIPEQPAQAHVEVPVELPVEVPSKKNVETPETPQSSKSSNVPETAKTTEVETSQSLARQTKTEPVPAKTHRRRRKVGLDDFSFLAVLGKGNFGKVMLAESKHTGHLYAVKVLKKNFIIENREVESTRSEKRVFLIANRERHPFLIKLFACFQTENRIYFVMDYVSGGDLMFHIQQKMFTARRAQFYAAEVLLALKHFHANGVIYRDLKLDNILLSLDGHIKLADYGLCKENMNYGSTTGTFCGTPDFIAPEILLDQKYDRSVDWWAFGVLMYQMLLGKSPFHGGDEEEVYDAILSDEPLYPIHMPRDSVSLLQQLLTKDSSKRLGSGVNDAEDIMAHPYFANINFTDLLNLKVEPPYKPELDSPTDVRYFERDFTSEMPALTPMNSIVTSDMQEEFRGFSYSMGDSI